MKCPYCNKRVALMYSLFSTSSRPYICKNCGERSKVNDMYSWGIFFAGMGGLDILIKFFESLHFPLPIFLSILIVFVFFIAADRLTNFMEKI